MFAIIPWRVDVPRERLPVVNWLIIVATVAVFWLQLSDFRKYQARYNPYVYNQSREESRAEEMKPGITSMLMLDGWSIRGLLGYMWLHGGFLHIAGNILFLWIFGNAICAKLGNLKYPFFYILFGVSAGVAHLLWSPGPAVGASGAISGVVGMYLVLFPQNDITCYLWFLLVFIRKFTVRSYWMIVFWLLWNVLGAFLGSGAQVAYLAHLGGFAVGFAVALVMCKAGWLTMERYEKSLLQLWQERGQAKR